MARNITVTFADGTNHVYQNAPDDITPEAVHQRAQQEFGKPVAAMDGGRGAAPAGHQGGVLEGMGQHVSNAVGGLVRGAGSIGATLVDAARGLGDAATNATPAALRPDVTQGAAALPRGAEMREGMDSGLQSLIGADPNSTVYKGGKIVSEIAGTAGVGGALSKAAQAAGASAPVIEALATSGMRAGGATGLGGAALRAGAGAAVGGASAGLVDPSQAGTGAAIGAVVPGAGQVVGKAMSGAGKVVGGAVRGAQAAIEPFTQGGRQAIAGRALMDAAGADAPAVASRLAQAAELVPGSVPTAGQVAENGGVAALERSLASSNPGAFAQRGMEQSSARVQALRGIAGDDVTRKAAVAAREAATGDLYKQATGATYTLDDRMQQLLQTPAMRQALARAETIAKNQQRPFTFEVQGHDVMGGLGNRAAGDSKQITGQGLQDLKMAMDEMLSDPASGYAGAAGSAVKQLRGKLLNWMEDANPAFKQARTTYAEKSKPIGQMDVGQELLKKLEPALSDHGALGRETAAKYAGALREADQTAQRATKFRGQGMNDLMTPDQLQIMENIAKDLARKTNAQDLGRGIGSNTHQNLVMGNLANKSGLSPGLASKLPGAVGAAVGAGIGGAVGGPVGAMAGAGLGKGVHALYGSAEGKVQTLLAESLLQPRTAAQMMQQEIARKALASAPRQALLSPASRDAIELLYSRASPLVLSGQ